MFGIDDAALAAVGAAGLDFLSGQATNKSNESIAERNNAWSAQQYATRYQTMTKDLQSAGLNPMLAYSQSPGSAPSAQSVQFQNPANFSGAVQSYKAIKDTDVMAAQIQNIDADSKLKEEQAKLIASQKLAADADERLKTATANEATVRMVSQQNYGNPAQQALAQSYWSQVQVNKATLPRIASEIVRNGADAGLANARARQAIAEGDITIQDLERAKNDARYERATGGVIRQGSRDLGNILGNVQRGQRISIDNRPTPQPLGSGKVSSRWKK